MYNFIKSLYTMHLSFISSDFRVSSYEIEEAYKNLKVNGDIFVFSHDETTERRHYETKDCPLFALTTQPFCLFLSTECIAAGFADLD